MQNILSRLDALREKLHDEAFLSNKGLSNKVGLYVFAYRPDEEMPVRHFLHSIAASENGQNGACRLIAYDLYDLLLDICRERRILDRIAQMEAQHGAEQAERGRQSAVAQRLTEFDALRTGPQGGQGGLISACTYFKENRGHASEFFKRRGRSHASEFFKRKNKLERIKEQRVR